LLAQIFQHEVDHLNGELFTDKAKQTWDMTDEEIAELQGK
jgi:peptide deformylase